MAGYFTNRRGETQYISDDSELKRLNDAEWGGAGESQQAQPSNEEKGSTTATQEKPEEKEPATVPDKWSDVGTKIMQKIRPTEERAALIEKNKEDDPLLKTEAPRFAQRAIQAPIDALVGFGQQLNAEGALDPSYILEKIGLGGLRDSLSGGKSEFDEKNFARYEANSEEIRKTGRLDGNRLGWQKDWFLPGLSQDSDYYKKHIKPESELTDLTAQVAGAIGTGGVLRRTLTGLAIKGPQIGAAFQTLPKNGVLASAALFLRNAAPEVAEELLLFPPQEIPDLTEEQQVWVEKFNAATTPAQKLQLKQMYLSETPAEYNYHKQQFLSAAAGGAIVGGAKWTWNITSDLFDIGWRSLRNVKRGIEPKKAWNEAYEQFKPKLEADVKNSVDEGVEQEIQKAVGDKTVDVDISLEKSIPETATRAREGGELYLSKTDNALKQQDESLQNIDIDATAIPEQKAVLNNELRDLKKTLKVTNEASIIAKRDLLDQRSVAYTEAQAADPNWLTKGKGKAGYSKNEGRVRELKKAINNMKRLQDIELELEKLDLKEQQLLESSTAYRTSQNAQLDAKVGFQKVLNEIRDQVSKTDDLLAERAKAVEMDQANQVRLGEQPQPDTFQETTGVSLQSELRDLVTEAQEAIDNDQLSPDFINNWVARIEDINNRAVSEGVSPAPIRAVGDTSVPEGQKLAPKQVTDNEIPVPLDKDGLVDTDLINQATELGQEASITTPRKTSSVLDDVRESLGTDIPAKTLKQFENIGDEVDQLIAKLEAAKQFDLENGTNTFEDNLEIFRATNASKYTADMSDQALLKVINDRVASNKSMDSILKKSLLEMSSFVDDPGGLRQLAYLIEEGKIARKNLKRLSAIPVNLAVLDANVKNAMASLRRYQNIKNGTSNELSLNEAVAVALADIKLLKASVRAVDPTAQYLGTGLGLFRKKMRLTFPTAADIAKKVTAKDPGARSKQTWELLANEWNSIAAKLDDPEVLLDKMSHAAKEASESFEATMGSTLKKLEKGEPISATEMAQAMSVMDAVWKTGGNFNKIQEIDKTWSGVMNQIITSGTLSNVRGPFGIIVGNFSQAIPAHTSGWAMGHITSKFARWAGKEALSEDIVKQAQLEGKWLKGYLYGIANSWEGFSNKMLFPEAHPDYVPLPTSLLNQQAKLDDLAATSFKVKTPFGEWAINKDDFSKAEIYNFVNYGRVWMKSMHDNFISGPDWEKLPAPIKGWRLPFGIGGERRIVPGLGFPIQIGREFGFGKKPYYAKGEDQSLTFALKSLSWADSFFTEVSGNAWARATVEMQLADDIAEGLVKESDKAAELARRLDKKTSELFQPVTAGIDQKIVGHQIRSKQFNSFKDFINLTEDLTGGPLGDMKSAIDTLKQSDSPALSAFATTLMPVTTSAFNWLKNVVRITSGFEGARAAVDLTRLGAKLTKEQIGERLPQQVVDIMRTTKAGTKWLDDAKAFESVYLSDDPIIRSRAQQALGMTLAFHASAFALVWNWGGTDWEVTGAMTHTYREAKGIKKPFHLKLDVPFMDFPIAESVEVPLLYLGAFGGTIALHTSIRDLQQFGNINATSDLVTLAIAAQARQMMEIPTIAGPDKITDALARAAQGDVRPIQRIIAEAVGKVGAPYLGYEKELSRFVFGAKPSSPLSGAKPFGLEANKYYKKGKLGDSLTNFGKGGVDTFIGTLGYRFEDTGVGPLMYALQSAIADDENIWKASRMAMPFGKPGELIEWSDMPRLAYPVEAVTGRIFPIPSRVDQDKVRLARLENLIPPPDQNLFSSEADGGVGISPSEVNKFNHFLNEEALIKSPWTNKTHVGIHSFILEIINRPEYKQLGGSDVVSPYTTGNWDRKNSERANWIKALIKNQINIVKWQWVDGSEYPNKIPDPKAPNGFRYQTWFAEPELRELLNSRKEE